MLLDALVMTAQKRRGIGLPKRLTERCEKRRKPVGIIRWQLWWRSASAKTSHTGQQHFFTWVRGAQLSELIDVALIALSGVCQLQNSKGYLLIQTKRAHLIEKSSLFARSVAPTLMGHVQKVEQQHNTGAPRVRNFLCTWYFRYDSHQHSLKYD